MNSGKPSSKLASPSGCRPLTSDEERLWSLVARTVRPLRTGGHVQKPAIETPRKPGVRDAPRPMKGKAPVGPNVATPGQRPPTGPALSPIMRKEKQKLARGHAAIDARIDLHGMTQTEAHAALRSLLHSSQAKGAKFVLVITGKGAPSAWRGDRGVLRRQVPMWLALPEFRRYVLGFDVADTGHGGEGALYVRLRKAKV
jgi:DNA-nicking Smr family endonuclease